jgi:hypothetical protein
MKTGFPSIAAAAALILLPAAAHARQAQPATPAPNPADVASVDAIVRALYDVISGDSGVARNWDRMRSLFAPGAQLIPVGPRQAGGFGARVLSVEDYIRISGPLLERNGFHEVEIAHRRETYGRMVHVFSSYESRRRLSDPRPFMRGINSIQLWHDGSRWWVQTVLWWSETPETPIPPRYLANERN